MCSANAMATQRKTVSLVYTIIALQVLLLLLGGEFETLAAVALFVIATFTCIALIHTVVDFLPQTGAPFAAHTGSLLSSAGVMVSAFVLAVLLWSLRGSNATWSSHPAWEVGTVLALCTTLVLSRP